MNQLNNFTDDEKEKEFYFQKLFRNFKRKTLSFFYMNLFSLTKSFDDFNILLNDLNVNFDIVAITESHIKKHPSSPVNLHLDNCSVEQTPIETSAGGTLLYINKRLKTKALSSTKD